jgi:magnesium transporter
MVTRPESSDSASIATPEFLGVAMEHATTRVPTADADASVEMIRAALLDREFDSAIAIAVCRGKELVGIIKLETLLSAPREAKAADLMDRDPPVVAPGTDQEAAAWTAIHRGESTLAVVDEQRRFVGLIPPERLLQVLLEEHDEDMARLGGFLKGASSARLASREPIARRFWHRVPWLMLGLVGAFAAAGIVGSFESELQENVILAFFLPGVVYMADAVGTQTETLVVRGLSVGVPIGEVVRREILTGLLVGIALALAFVPVALWRWGKGDVVVAVAISLFAACSIATGVAMLLPWALHRLGRDPAFGSGPLATVIQDLLSVLIYFVVAVTIVG